MTAYYAALALGGVLLAIGVWLKAIENAEARIVDTSHEETP